MLQFGSAAIGSLLGGGLGIGSRTGWMLGSLLGSQFGKKPVIEGKRLDDLTVQASTYGKPIPLIYGRAILKGNIIWSSGIKEKSSVTKQRVNLLTKVKVKDYRYFANLAIGLCEGEIQGLQRIWANGRLIYDQTFANSSKIKAFDFNFRFHTGSESQMPDPLIAGAKPDAPAFRGLSYVVFEDFPLEEFNNHIPQFTFEVSRLVSPQARLIEIANTDQETDNICFHEASPWLFLRDQNRMSCVDRDTNKIEKSSDFTHQLPRTDQFSSKLFGHLVFDPQLGCVYAFGQHQLSSFIVKLDPLTGMIQNHNFDTKLIGDEQIGFVDGQLLYTGDFLKGIIRVYQTSDLSRLYEVPGAADSGLHVRPTNFTKDDQGRVWLASFDATHHQDFYLTRLQGQERVAYFKIQGYGQANGIVYDKCLKRLVVCSLEGLVIINPETGQVEQHIAVSKGYSTAFAQSTFLNTPVTQGKIWLAKHGEAIQIDLTRHVVSKRIPFEVSFRACTFDTVQEAFWLKGGCLSKLLFRRKSPAALKLPDVVDSLLRRGGFKADELQIDLNSDPVHGLVIPHPMPLYKALSPLKQAAFFHVRSHANRLQCFYPEAGKIVDVHKSDLGACEERRHGEELVLHEALGELPREVELLYPSIERQFNVSICKSRLHARPSAPTLRLEMPLLLKDAEAQHIAERLLLMAWERCKSFIFTLPPKYMFLEVGDRLLVREEEILITQLSYSSTGLIEIEGWMTQQGNKNE